MKDLGGFFVTDLVSKNFKWDLLSFSIMDIWSKKKKKQLWT
jgi:hypothetical protein